MKFASAIIVLGSVSTGALARTFTVTNKCSYTVWPAIFTDLNVGTAVPDHPTGWEAPSGSSVSFNVPDNWKAGRIWGRTQCDFSGANAGPLSCATGGCNGGLLCDAHTGTGVPPATLAEWTLGDANGPDYYDVSVVDGSNVPLEIINNQGCNTSACAADLNPDCPAALAKKDASGNTVGCMTSCFANLDGNQSDSGNCCSGSHDTPATCPVAKVANYNYFKTGCPDAYAYAYDESSQSALFTCHTTSAADYTLIFCPQASTSSISSSATQTTTKSATSTTAPAPAPIDPGPTNVDAATATVTVTVTAACTPTA